MGLFDSFCQGCCGIPLGVSLLVAWFFQGWHEKIKLNQERKQLEKRFRMRESQENQRELIRQQTINQHYADWGEWICQHLINNEVVPGMTEEMVKLALGENYDADEKEVSPSGKLRYRWVYGVKRRNAVYVWFEDGKVKKVKDTR